MKWREHLVVLTAILVPIVVEGYRFYMSRDIVHGALILPVIGIALFYILVSAQLARGQVEVQRILDARLPRTMYLTEQSQVVSALVSIIQRAESYIVASGSRSSQIPYLSAIEERVKEGVPYWRIILTTPITRELCDHLSRLVDEPNVFIAWTEESDIGNTCLTDHGVVVALPTPRPEELLGIFISDRNIARRFKSYMDMVYGSSRRVASRDEIQGLRNPHVTEVDHSTRAK